MTPFLGRCVVVGAGGAVGQLLSRLLSEAGHEVVGVDLSLVVGPFCEVLVGNITSPTCEILENIGRADLLVLAVPEAVAVAALPVLRGRLLSTAVLLDTLSVKTGYLRGIEEMGIAQQVVSINPMCSPAMGLRGQAVGVVLSSPEAQATKLVLEALRIWGTDVVLLDADRHDRLVSGTQALTHMAILSFGQALLKLELDLPELARISTPPFATMMALLARVVSGSPEVYSDIQIANFYSGGARAAFIESAQQLAALVDSRNEHGFSDMFKNNVRFFGETLDTHKGICAEIFSDISPHRRS